MRKVKGARKKTGVMPMMPAQNPMAAPALGTPTAMPNKFPKYKKVAKKKVVRKKK